MKAHRFDVRDFTPAAVTEEEGWHKMDIRFLVTEETAGSGDAAWWRTVFPPGAAHKKHIHHDADEIVYGIRGRGAEGIDDEECLIEPGVAVYIPKGKVHWTRNLSGTEELEVVGIYAGVGSLEASGYEYIGEVQEADKTI